MPEEKKKIPVTFPEQLRGGVYANYMSVSHTKEEFIMDFTVVAFPFGSVTARVITSPGHMKRIISALQENLQQYEASFKEIEPAEEPKGGIGYIPPTK